MAKQRSITLLHKRPGERTNWPWQRAVQRLPCPDINLVTGSVYIHAVGGSDARRKCLRPQSHPQTPEAKEGEPLAVCWSLFAVEVGGILLAVDDGGAALLEHLIGRVIVAVEEN
jgi:hypothetical protein